MWNEEFQGMVLTQLDAIRKQLGTMQGQQSSMREQLARLTHESAENANFKDAVLEHLAKVTQDLTELRTELSGFRTDTQAKLSQADDKLEYLLRKSIQTDMEILRIKQAR